MNRKKSVIVHGAAGYETPGSIVNYNGFLSFSFMKQSYEIVMRMLNENYAQEECFT